MEANNIENGFTSLKIDGSIVSKLQAMEINTPSPIQEKAIPLILEGKNILFQSETGSGKTFAYLLPLLTSLKASANPEKNVTVLIVSPTYELCSQIKVQVQLISEYKPVLCIGGAPLSRQIEMLKEKPEILIGSPQRILELIHLKKIKADKIKTLVMDEADRLLSPELRDTTCDLLQRLSKNVQLVANSATVNPHTKDILEKERGRFLSEEELNQSGIVFVSVQSSEVLQNNIEHWAIFAERRDKIDTLRSFINAVKPQKLLVFAERGDQVENIVSKLKYRKINCEGLSAKTDKVSRKSFIDRFRSGKLPVLVTTDLTSRGLDIPNITHVVQMNMSEEKDYFIHRSGRTARAGRHGVNCVIGDQREMETYSRMEKKLHIKVYPKILYQGKLMAPSDLDMESDLTEEK